MFFKNFCHFSFIRIYCKESFNKIYQTNIELLEKIEGRNEDIESKNMSKQYDYLKKQADKNRQRLEKVNRQTEFTLSKSKEVKEIISNLKPNPHCLKFLLLTFHQELVHKFYLHILN